MGSAATGKIIKCVIFSQNGLFDQKNGKLTNFVRFNENEIFYGQRGHNKASLCAIRKKSYQTVFEKIMPNR